MFAGNFPPAGWAFCNGQVMPINQNTALFSLLGTYYGGDGTTTFALPNLQSRLPIGQGAGPGLTSYVVGQVAGTEQTTLVVGNLPVHSHSVVAASPSAGTPSEAPTNNALAVTARNETPVYTSAAPNTAMDASSVGTAGQGVAFSKFQPSLAVSFIIALQGIFPSRN